MTGPHQKMLLSRRDFLKTLGAAAVGASLALPSIIPASALGRDGAVAPSNRVVMGVIGIGPRATATLPYFMGFKEIQMRAACDCRADRLAKAKGLIDGFYQNRDCATHHDFRELLARPDIDAVMIATGDRWHSLASIAAAQAGKDIYCEKPISLTVAEGRAMADTMCRLGTTYQAGHQRRSVDSYRFMIEAVRRGAIGRVHTVIMQSWECPPIPIQPVVPVPEGFDYEMWLGQVPWRPFSWSHVKGWNYFWDFSDSMISGMGCHYTDIMQWALDTEKSGPVEFEGEAEFPDPALFCSDTPPRCEVRMTYASGVKGIARLRGEYSERHIRFIGDEGWIQLDDDTDLLTTQPASILSLRNGMSKSWADNSGHIGDFLRAIRERTPTLCHAETSHRSETICQVSDICLRLGRKLRWDSAAERFVHDEEADRMLARVQRAPWHL